MSAGIDEVIRKLSNKLARVIDVVTAVARAKMVEDWLYLTTTTIQFTDMRSTSIHIHTLPSPRCSSPPTTSAQNGTPLLSHGLDRVVSAGTTQSQVARLFAGTLRR